MPHIHEKIDYTADVYIVCNNKVLLRMHDKHKLWFAVGGHVELDEDPNQAAVREVKEEVGLDVVLDDSRRLFRREDADYQELIPPYALNRHLIKPGHEHVSLVYFARSTSMDVVPEGDDKSDDWAWLSKEDLESNKLDVPAHIKIYALEALKVLSKSS
jgi:8-oxo-dGTP pyrophosphatase MutT (NUDIX family)